MEIVEKILPWVGVVILVGGVLGFLFRSIGQENFRKALIGIAHTNATITVEMVVDLYLGAYEKPKSNFSASDMKRLESSFLWALAALARETDPSKKIAEETLLNMQALARQIRAFKPNE